MEYTYKLAPLLLCLALVACGNKGDLFLVPDELTAAQLELLEDIEKKKAEEEEKRKKRSNKPDTEK